MASASGIASQVCSCLCLYMMFSWARVRAYTPPMMGLACILCLCSSSSTYNIITDVASLIGVKIPSPVR